MKSIILKIQDDATLIEEAARRIATRSGELMRSKPELLFLGLLDPKQGTAFDELLSGFWTPLPPITQRNALVNLAAYHARTDAGPFVESSDEMKQLVMPLFYGFNESDVLGALNGILESAVLLMEQAA
jgi:hypothetical protein